MLCKVCVGMLRGGRGELWVGSHDLTFEHHKTTTTLRRSREADCTICMALVNMLLGRVDVFEDRPISITARLRELPRGDWGENDRGNRESSYSSDRLSLRRAEYSGKKFCLDFSFEKTLIRTFLLKEISSTSRDLHTPQSLDTSSDEVFGVAKAWLEKCQCPLPFENSRWYPKRLLDLNELRNANGLRDVDGLKWVSEHIDIERTKIRLVQSEGGQIVDNSVDSENYRYVTLSHCWGKPRSLEGQLKLSYKTEERFKSKGIELKELPKTFRDVILFACRLEKVRYIWIDSLCIMQREKNTESDKDGIAHQDWLQQSREMYKIYQGSFLNISATAAKDGDIGLFVPRQPEYLWEDEINVNYSGTNLFGSETANSNRAQPVTRCTLVDVSLWDELVERAPVNRRGWVLQERLMAPRVLHFCKNQVAWECAEFQFAEGNPDTSPSLKERFGNIVDEGRLKDLSNDEGIELREIRLRDCPDPDVNMPDLGVYELWKRVVEVYSKTQLTVSSDKLIALSGIAESFWKMFTSKWKPQYIAGLWSKHLESQLLWQVNEVYRDGQFDNPARRDSTRAPSFSWASIDTPYGINYADTTDFLSPESRREQLHSESMIDLLEESGRDTQSPSTPDDLLFKVHDFSITLSDSQNEFGMIEKALLLVQPHYLRRIKLRRLDPPLRVPHSWHLDDADSETSPVEYTNLYLDTPETDADIFKHDAELYILPAAFGERTTHEASRYMYCLLLKYEGDVRFSKSPAEEESQAEKGEVEPIDYSMKEYRGFRRIGITKLSNYANKAGQEAVTTERIDELIVLQ